MRNFLDKSGYIDVGGTRRGTRRIETIQTTVRFGYCGDTIERRMNFRESRNKLRVRFLLLGRVHTTLLGDAVPILYPRASTKAPHFSMARLHHFPFGVVFLLFNLTKIRKCDFNDGNLLRRSCALSDTSTVAWRVETAATMEWLLTMGQNESLAAWSHNSPGTDGFVLLLFVSFSIVSE
ncbi:MAG TPA: hypothetical protein VKP58_13105 [Candidatus Acidoferrum sp.]|nr:hypothetical protein [Candidatus Acidoferrum sp.]